MLRLQPNTMPIFKRLSLCRCNCLLSPGNTWDPASSGQNSAAVDQRHDITGPNTVQRGAQERTTGSMACAASKRSAAVEENSSICGCQDAPRLCNRERLETISSAHAGPDCRCGCGDVCTGGCQARPHVPLHPGPHCRPGCCPVLQSGMFKVMMR